MPAGTPTKDVGTSPVPATGPYKVQEFLPNRKLTLVRNPSFREWSRAAQPDGYPDTIDWSLSGGSSRAGVDAAVDAVERGRADLYNDQPPNDRMDELTTRYTGQTHLWPYAASFAMYLNTRVPPFDDPRVRRAVGYAVDRRAVQGCIRGQPRSAANCCRRTSPATSPTAPSRWTPARPGPGRPQIARPPHA